MRNALIAIILIFIGLVNFTFAQDAFLHPNRGQWDDRISYKMDLSLGEILIGGDGIIYNLNDVQEKIRGHHGDEHSHESDTIFNFHVIKAEFVGANWSGEVHESDQSTFYRNYILGNDQSRWASKVYSYQTAEMQDVFPGVNVVWSSKAGNLKYNFVIDPGVSTELIKIKYSGQDKLSISEEGKLIIGSTFGEIVESIPSAWYEIDGKRKDVEVDYKLVEDIVSFDVKRKIPSGATLVIDPDITFSTFTGSTTDNWGMSATPDVAGNLFGGGTIFQSTSGGTYPTTTGAYSSTHSGGSVDIGVTKFTDDGTALIYSTYIGGNGSETPNSMVANANGDLYIFGNTSSSNFPMAGVPFDNSYAGGPNLTSQANGLGFSQGSDLYVARLSSDGTSLLASTYVGGSGADGFNTTALLYNYGDQFRGEIILDDNENVYVASTTQSTDFPTVTPTQGSLSGTQDAVLFKMNSTLSVMLWSTYFGGTGVESGNSVQIASNGIVYMAGGTSSNNLPIVNGEDLTYNGGISDGYLARFSSNTGNMISGTYMGLSEYDQAFFVQLDIDDKVYVFGQSTTNWGITPGHYGNANSGQFLRKYNESLSTIEWTTMIGAGTGNVEISPTAFLVSECYDIYLSGWGGQLNQQFGQATQSTTNGFPTTPGAYQTNTNGSNFYIAVLDQDAVNLKYGTFMGGLSSPSNHVDGGTSRFDKTGRIYHAVCGSCGSTVQNGFSTTPGAYSTVALGPNCNMACFKFELSTIEAAIANPIPVVCIPDPVIFNNNSSNGNAFFWDFGDGNTSTAVNPSHNYTSPGDYTVTLVVSDTNGCYSPDSIEFIVSIGDFVGGVVTPPTPICPGDSFEFEAYGGANYEWTPAQFLDDPTIYNPTATVDQTTDFQVIISDSCGIDTVDVTLFVYQVSTQVSDDVGVCIGNSTTLSATGGASYVWSPATYLSNPNSSNPVCTPLDDITYTVEITTADGCVVIDTVNVDVFFNPPIPVLPDSLEVCLGTNVEVVASGGDTYFWYPSAGLNTNTGSTVLASPNSSQYYYCDFTNACATVTDSVYITVLEATITAGTDTIICPGDTAMVWAEGGVSYNWIPSVLYQQNNGAIAYVRPNGSTVYIVEGTDEKGCIDYDSVRVDLFPKPSVQTVPDVYAIVGDAVQLGVTSINSAGTYVWSPPFALSCTNCTSPIANPNQTYTYLVSYTDENSCQAQDHVTIHYDPILYVPNTFTPDGDEYNNTFSPIGSNIEDYEMLIFDRWGEIIFETHDLNIGWDGTYNGILCQDGTYTWKITLKGYDTDEKEVHVGHINIIR